MTTDDELRALIAAGDKATPRPWAFYDAYDIIGRPGIVGAHRMGTNETTVIEASPYGHDEIHVIKTDAEYLHTAANLAPEIARELIEARELHAKITEISELASEMWYRLVIIANDMNNWEVYLEFVDPSDDGIEGESISVYADTMIAAIDKAIRMLKGGDK